MPEKDKRDIPKESKTIALVALVPFLATVILLGLGSWAGFLKLEPEPDSAVNVGILAVIVVLAAGMLISLVVMIGATLNIYRSTSKPDPDEKKISMVFAAILPFFSVILFMGWLLYTGFFKIDAAGVVNNVVVLPLIVVLAVAMLISLLTMLTGILNYFNLTDKCEPFGLPVGSVRALIALGLLVIFAVVAIFLYGSLAESPTEDQVKFANQLLTTVSTLLVAVAGFYFGVKAVETAKDAEKAAVLFISPSDSAEIEKGEDGKYLPLTIKAKISPEDEVITWEIDDPAMGSLVQEKQNQFKFTPSDAFTAEKTVTLTFVLAKYPKASEKLKVGAKSS